MRLLHVIHSIDPRSGGPSHALRGLVAEQVRRGHRVTVTATTAQSGGVRGFARKANVIDRLHKVWQ